MDRSVDRLAFTSRVIFDQRIIDLRKENEELRAKDAWTRFGRDSLEKSITMSCSEIFPAPCSCPSCWKAKRFDTTADTKENMMSFFLCNTDTECIIRKRLLAHAQAAGLTVAIRSMPTIQHTVDPNIFVEITRKFYDESPECHLEILVDDDGTWELQYGSKLTMPNFHQNPDLIKLQNLFETIEEPYGEFLTGV
jgi:hypothetical protein